MTTEEIDKILIRYKVGQCTDLEKTIIEETFMKFNEGEPDLSPKRIEKIGAEIYKALPGAGNKTRTVKLWPLISAVACVSIIMIGVLIFYPRNERAIVQDNLVQDIKPGSNKATLTLSNGQTINLSDAKTGIIIDSKKLTYNDRTAIATVDLNKLNTTGFQTISTPKGGQYQIVLPDGAKVWLNAATTLQFSANLKRERGERKVKLISGEAYFEVFKDKKHPFVVQIESQEVQVLGTYFNINAYSTEIKTTLVEGSVKINPQGKSHSVILKPGEQSKNKDDGFVVKKVDTDLAVAWKNGKTEFRDADLKTVMQMLERWYNIEVIYNGITTDSYYSGSVSRTRNISEVLQLLESTGEVHFKIEGRRVEILK